MFKQGGSLKSARLLDVKLDADDTRKFNFHIRRDRGELLFARCWILGEGETEASLIPECARILKSDFEQIGIRFVTYQTGISLEPCLLVANGMGINWVVLADNDAQGANDHATVKKHLNGRLEAETLFVMPEANIEQHLCVNGFADVYYALLSHQPKKLVTAKPADPAYPIQVATALPKKLKTHAAQQVIGAMRAGRPIPNLFKNAIEAAVKLATQL
jgi:putative ATP-dependent endonuclease of OLD family